MNWRETKSASYLRIAIAVLKAKTELAYFQLDDTTASDAHDDLVAAEWRLWMLERRA